MKTFSISKKMIILFICCMIFCSTSFCVISFIENYKHTQNYNKEYVESCAALVAETIHHYSMDDIIEYLVSDNSEDMAEQKIAYEVCGHQMEEIRKDMGLIYTYIFIPTEDGSQVRCIVEAGLGDKKDWKNGEIIDLKVSEECMLVFNGALEKGTALVDNEYGYVVTGYAPVYDTSGEIVAVAGADLETNELLREFMDKVKLSLITITFSSLIIFSIIIIVNKKIFVKPVIELSNNMESFILNRKNSGEFKKVEIKSRDEIGKMAAAFNQMADDTERYLQQVKKLTVEAEREKAEIDAARSIQKASLPNGDKPFSDDNRFTLCADMEAAKYVGGDFYDFFKISDSLVCTVIGDVSGKGMGAALFMMRSMTLIKEQAIRQSDLSKVLEYVNAELCTRNDENMFVTAFIGVLDLETGGYRYANAGHNPPCILKNDMVSFAEVKQTAPMGLFDDENYYEEKCILEKDEGILLYTDGVTEALNKENCLFGNDRLIGLLSRVKNERCEDILKGIKEELYSFVKDAEQSDDITLLIMKRK